MDLGGCSTLPCFNIYLVTYRYDVLGASYLNDVQCDMNY